MVPIVVAIVFGLAGGLALWYWGAPTQSVFERSEPAVPQGTETLSPSEIESGGIVERYTRAVQQGMCDEISEITWWMQERIAYVRQTGSAEELAEARANLCEAATSRDSGRRMIGGEGIADQYVFRPESTWRIVRVDEGRDDLSKPVGERAWLKVTHSLKTRAPLDEMGNPIRSMMVGINVSTDNFVLKAGVRGNVEIDFDSFQYDW